MTERKMKMKKIAILIGVIALIISGGYFANEIFRRSENKPRKAENAVVLFNDDIELQNGDIIFQTSLSQQSKAIQLATNSIYSHCGIIFNKQGKLYVYEAIQPVTSTPLDKWIARGKNGHYVIKRLKNVDQILTTETLQKMKQEADKFKGKNYDLTFEWSDDNIYCSELIWKIYQRATGLEIGQLEKLSDFDLSHQTVKQKMKERYGDEIPMNEPVISPASIHNSELLITVSANL